MKKGDTLEERAKVDIYIANVDFIKNYLITEHDRRFMTSSDRESAFNDGIIIFCESLLTYKKASPVVEDAVNEYMVHVKRDDIKIGDIKSHGRATIDIENIISHIIKKKKKILMNSFHNPESANEMFDDGVITLMNAIGESGIDKYDISARKRYTHASEELYRGIISTLERIKRKGNGKISSSAVL